MSGVSEDALASCVGKKAFHNEGRARVAAKGSARTFGRAFQAYVCPHCDHWHVGSSLGKLPKPEKRRAKVWGRARR